MPKSFWTDQPIFKAEQDRFDFLDYADALSDIVLGGSTPITIGIFGPWGSGKTSLMRLLARNLLGARAANHRHAHIVWFNAWQYERDESAIWRSLLLRVLEAVKEMDLSLEDARHIDDWETRLYTDVNRTERGSLKIDWPELGKGALQLGLSLIPSPANVVELLKALEGDVSTVESLIEAFRHEEIDIFRRQIQLLEEFQGGFAHLVKEYFWSRNGMLVICVDDLDRCLPDRALEVLETIKLFLDVQGCVFLLAADHQRIEDVVQERFGYQEKGRGESYLEKLVQLPFYLPPLDGGHVAQFLTDVAVEIPEEVQAVFTAGLAPNPRIIKRTLNIFQLLQNLAQRRMAHGTMGDIDPRLLAKIVIIQMRFQDLYRDLLEYPNLIQELELRATEHEEIVPLVRSESAATTPLVAKYIHVRPLLRMLRVPGSFAELSASQISAYIHLALPTGGESAVEAPIPRQLLDDLLSSDITRIRAAVGRVRQRAQEQEYVKALGLLVSGERSTTGRERLSAAYALGYLGDPRDLAAVLEIPGGEFLYGETGDLHYVNGYQIRKYPVTNAQYARFLAEYPEVPVPYVDEDWAYPYNWDSEQRTPPEGKANYPVVLVTWDEAQAFAAWVGGRLPSELEWERAVRGDDGRPYPWGEGEPADYVNVRESGLGGPTPVGVFLEAASPYQLMDGAGNVWEWTASDFNMQTKVMRGGAWNFPFASARAFVRECSRPDNRSRSIGFRVAYDLPLNET